MNLSSKRTSRTVASLLVTGAAALGVVGCGSSSDATTNAAATATTSTTQQGTSTTGQRGPGGGAAISSADLATAAKKLGVTSSQLQAAITAARPTRPSGTAGAQPNAGAAGGSGTDPRATMYAAIAKKLGTTSAKVESALSAVLPTGGPGGGAGGPGGTPPSGASGATPPAASGSSSSTTSGTTSAS